MRDRWVFVTFVVVWFLVASWFIFVVIRDRQNHVPFGFGSWVAALALVSLAVTLLQSGRLRLKVGKSR